MDAIEQIKERLSLADYVARTVPLHKSGRNLRGLCPFHQEKTPSFFVFPETNRWHCFGCGRGGDIFNFVMEQQGLDFRGALEELARLAGVDLHPQTPEERAAAAERDRLLQVLEAATIYYHRLLLSAPQAAQVREYLARRGFTSATWETFRLGYSLPGWDAARTHLLGQGFTLEELIKAGMLVQKEDGGTYDRFRGRLMIPITDAQNRVVAFGARALHPDDQPKYLNSPQSPLFDKSRILFGLAQAARAIREADQVVIVEGYTDVMMAHQAGFANVVAPMGTALTAEHLQHLQRLTRRFVLALDPDAAGLSATLRGLETARENLDREISFDFNPQGLMAYERRLKADLRVLSLPDQRDPDELIRDEPTRWQELVANARSIVEFVFTYLLGQENAHDPKGKARIVDQMLPLLREVADSIERDAYVQMIATRLGLDPLLLQERLRVRERVRSLQQRSQVQPLPTAQADVENHILAILLRDPTLEESLNAWLASYELAPFAATEDLTGQARLLWEGWQRALNAPEQPLETWLPEALAEHLVQLQRSQLPDDRRELERALRLSLLRLREQRLRVLIQALSQDVREAQAANEEERWQKSLQMMQAYSATLGRLHAAMGEQKPRSGLDHG